MSTALAELATDLGAAEAFAARLASGVAIVESVALVVAHPDDETLFAGSALPRLVNLTLIHLTDGAPRDMGDARRHGFATRADYAAARADELDRALAALGGSPRRIGYGLIDQEACRDMAVLTRRLAADLAGMTAVITHPYEGGHPDHDAAAFAVAGAVRLIAASGAQPPALVEFACYRKQDGQRVFGRFGAGPREHVRSLDLDERRRVAKALAAHASQTDVFGDWRPDAEGWRAAPAYDFAVPPEGGALYDDFGWTLTSAEWRGRATAAKRDLA